MKCICSRRFLRRKGASTPTFGVSRGRYWKASPHSLTKLSQTCNFNVSNATAPPSALMLPGLLSQRPYLSDLSLCFLFYTEKLWTRATGGARGVPLSRMGGGIDDKELLAESLSRYEHANKCRAPATREAAAGDDDDAWGVGGYPPTVALKDKAQCEEFFNANDKWAPDAESLWFVKDAHGSLGRHVRLLRYFTLTHARTHTHTHTQKHTKKYKYK